MATEEYVDAGHAVDFRTLSDLAGKAPAVAKGINYERILKAREAEPHNWITYYGAYDGKRYSPLDQINVDNVKSLIPAWVFQAGSLGMHSGASTYAFEASPLVVDGVMYVTGWDGWIWALDARTGAELWRYKHASPYDVSLCCGNVNRGCAVAQGMVFMTTLNAHIHRARRRDRRSRLGPGVWRCAGRRERDRRSPDRQGHGDRRELWRGVRGARPRRRLQARDRRAGLALLHGPQARGAGVRDLARRR